MYSMSRRIVLRLRGPFCSHRSMCGRQIFGRICNRLFKLFIGDIFVVCIFNKLLELSRGLISSLDRIDNLCGMPWRIILCNNRSHSYNGKLLFRILLYCLFNGVFKLSCWCLPSNCRLFELFAMPWRVLLRQHWPDCRDGCLYCGIILGGRIKYLHYLFDRIFFC